MPGSKKKDSIYLVSFGNHQYGTSGILGIRWLFKKALEAANVGLLKKGTVDTKTKESWIGAGFNRVGQLYSSRSIA